jgi:hypothetical protein
MCSEIKPKMRGANRTVSPIFPTCRNFRLSKYLAFPMDNFVGRQNRHLIFPNTFLLALHITKRHTFIGDLLKPLSKGKEESKSKFSDSQSNFWL